MTKVVFVSHWDWVLHNFRLDIAAGLRDAGCEVALVCPAGDYSAGFGEQGFRWIDWPVTRRGANPAREASALRSLISIYRREAPDVAHHFTAKPNLYGSIAAARTGVPVVINTFSGLGYLFSSAPAARMLRTVLRSAFAALGRREGTWTLVQNRSDLETLVERGFVRRDRTRLVHSGVDTSRFRPPAEERSTDGPVVVLMAARLLHDKGVGDLVAAGRLLHSRGADVLVRIAGEPDPGNPSTVTADEIESWGRNEAIEFLGMRDDMPDQLNDAHVALLPTRYNEGIPRFLLEAAACGLPLIATDIPGCRETVRDGVNGRVVPVGDPRALADTVEEFAADPQLRRRYGAASRRIVEDEFSMDRFVEAHLDIYHEVGVL